MTGFCLLLMLFAPPTDNAKRWIEILRREMTALSAEQQSIEVARTNEDTNFAQTQLELSSEIATLEREEQRLSRERAALREQALAHERAHSMVHDQVELERKLRSLREWMGLHNLSVPDEGPQALVPLLTAFFAYEEDHGGLHLHQKETVYGRDGSGRQATVLQVGATAAVLWESPEATPLLPVPDGGYREAPVRGFRNDLGSVRLLRAVLFDPATPNASVVERPTWWQWFHRGGALMWPIFAMGLLVLAVAIESLGRYAINRAPLAPSRSVLLSWIITAAPLVGLLGTVTGMIRTFAAITEHGTGDPRLLSVGISEALLTTQFGLSVAIPTMLLLALLREPDTTGMDKAA